MEQPLNRSFIISFKISYKPPAVGVAVRCEPPRESNATPRLSPACFRTAAFFCGIRRNSSKTKVSFRRAISFTAEKKKVAARAVYSAVFRLCAARSGVYSVFRLLGVQGVFCGCFGRGRVCRLISLFCCNIYSVGLVLWV